MRAILTALCLMLSLSGFARAEGVTVFAAASLKTALDALKPQVKAATGHDLTLVYAGSSALARQIAQGAPADIFISAHVAWMDDLQAKGLLETGSRLDLLGNALVLVSHKDGGAIDLETYSAPNGRVAMGLVEAVPAGIYARAALEHFGLWQAIAPRAVQTENVRAALALVARGEAAYGIVYRSDARAEPTVHLRATFPSESHAPIVYPAALTTGAGEAALQVLRYLQSAEAAETFVAQGFDTFGAKP